MKFGHLILGKIFKFVATICQILRLKCTKFSQIQFRLGLRSSFRWGAYSARQTFCRVVNGNVGKGERRGRNDRGE